MKKIVNFLKKEIYIRYVFGVILIAPSEYVLTLVLTEFFGVYYLVSYIISLMIGFYLGFNYQKKVTFNANHNSTIMASKFLLIRLLFICINVGSVYLLTHWMSYLIAIPLVAPVFIVEYLINKHWTFGHGRWI